MAALGPRFCSQCGQPLAEAANFCSACGARTGPAQAQPQALPSAPVRVAVPPSPKSMALVVVLAIIPAFFGVYGIGHFYVGRVGRGFVILLGDWAIAVVGVALIVMGFLPDFPTSLIVLAFVFFAGTLALGIWQVFDAIRLTREWNGRVAQTGRRPW
ncbi:MAG: zinc-ribbon domain-containing protein [Chloroflexi bacterium]|nr:zinc-ribbon domain-containing protein [Chloroflexota bacterium]